MRPWIQALMLAFALHAAVSASASTITGAEGRLAPSTDYTVAFRADGLYDFSAIDIGSGITVHFDAGTTQATLLSLGDIVIAGILDATGINLTLETPGQIYVTGALLAGKLDLITGNVYGSVNNGSAGATLCVIASGGCSTQSAPPASYGGYISIGPAIGAFIPPSIDSPGPATVIQPVIFSPITQPGVITGLLPKAVPEPGTLWLSLVPILFLLRRKRAREKT